MHKFYCDSHLGTILGPAALPNEFGRIICQPSNALGTTHSVVLECSADQCTNRQDSVVPTFSRTEGRSQPWNELCYIHFLRMVAMGVDDSYQRAIEAVCIQAKGDFKKTSIKGHVRMKNKCLSKDDHYPEKYPRCQRLHDIVSADCTILFLRIAIYIAFAFSEGRVRTLT